MADEKPIIVVKKKGGHGGHHGGAWKVAYADFVTAMMAFFMVMWLVNSASAPTKQAIASYFRKPGLFSEGSGTPLQIGGAGILPDAAPPLPEEKKVRPQYGLEMMQKKSGAEDEKDKKRITTRGDTGKGTGDEANPTEKALIETSEDLPKDGQVMMIQQQQQAQQMAEVAGKIEKEIAESKEFKELIGIVDVRMEADGLNIEIMDTAKTSMFLSGSASITPQAELPIRKIADLIKRLPNSLDIIGHTDAMPFSKRPDGYSNWELSSDRANAARRMLINAGIAPERIANVAGRADRELKYPKTPEAAGNRRILLKMRFKTLPQKTLPSDPYAIDRFRSIEDGFNKDLKAAEDAKEAAKTLEEKRKEDERNAKAAEASAAAGRKVTLLPEERSREESKYPPPSLIFGDNPVVGPPDRISNF